MSYRTIKRALGETNLERKCRVAFGFCLALLVFCAFWYVDMIAERLVATTIHRIGRDWANISLYRTHWYGMETNEVFKPIIRQLEGDFLTENYHSEYLALSEDEVEWNWLPQVTLPQSPTEREVVARLRDKWRAQLIASQAEDALPKDDDEPGTGMEPVFEEDASLARDEYYYYQPVYWQQSCLECHKPPSTGMSATQTLAAFDPSSPPFRVVKVTMPHKKTRTAIIETRVILIAVGIMTIFVAMILLYVIVKYVIVKPLKHLRDVSEEISKGNTELRAQIETHDEFEELADAFNRMLRHLTEAQAELREVNADLDVKVDELAQVNMRLYEMNRLKSDFLANMSHELRTPLNSIIGFSEVLQGIDSLNDKQRRYATNIQKSGRVLLEMINDILDLAKLEAGKMDLRPSEFHIETVVAAQCDMMRALSEEKNIDLDVRLPDEEPVLYQDQAKVQQILMNLLSNAIKFTPEGGRITVSAQRTPRDQLELIVEDTGVGIPEEDREIIFEKFRQSTAVLGSDGLTREYSGTGLGLSIVKEVCKLLGGEIHFTSELGKGSTFRVSLPWTLAGQSEFSSNLADRLAAASTTPSAVGD